MQLLIILKILKEVFFKFKIKYEKRENYIKNVSSIKTKNYYTVILRSDEESFEDFSLPE
jgi:hypothetical protein